MRTDNRSPQLAVFLATSGHSGVDRIMKNLIHELGRRSLTVDLLKIEKHGPYWNVPFPSVRTVRFPTAHVNSAIPHLVRYLRTRRPRALLCDKDRVNRAALIAAKWSRFRGNLVIRVGTTVSKNLERRSPWDRWIQYLSIRHLYPAARALVVPSQGAAEDLRRIGGFPRSFIHVLPSPVVDDSVYREADAPVDHPWFRDPEIPIVLGAGELCARKDFATLIRAFARLRSSMKARLVILGRGRKRESLLELARTLGVSKDVWFPGFVDNPYAYMKKASVFVLASVCEGSPVVLMEALALGTPVVSTDCPSGPREILKGGELGPLVPVGDPSAMAQAILEVLKNPPEKEKLRAAAERYSVRRAADAYLRALGLDDCSR